MKEFTVENLAQLAEIFKCRPDQAVEQLRWLIENAVASYADRLIEVPQVVEKCEQRYEASSAVLIELQNKDRTNLFYESLAADSPKAYLKKSINFIGMEVCGLKKELDQASEAIRDFNAEGNTEIVRCFEVPPDGTKPNSDKKGKKLTQKFNEKYHDPQGEEIRLYSLKDSLKGYWDSPHSNDDIYTADRKKVYQFGAAFVKKNVLKPLFGWSLVEEFTRCLTIGEYRHLVGLLRKFHQQMVEDCPGDGTSDVSLESKVYQPPVSSHEMQIINEQWRLYFGRKEGEAVKTKERDFAAWLQRVSKGGGKRVATNQVNIAREVTRQILQKGNFSEEEVVATLLQIAKNEDFFDTEGK